MILQDEVSWNVPFSPQYLWEVESATQAFFQNIENKTREKAAIKDIHFNPVGTHLKTLKSYTVCKTSTLCQNSTSIDNNATFPKKLKTIIQV